ncbi:MAG: M16 family metallopeptidase [Thermodesulfobacteriota bacterium]
MWIRRLVIALCLLALMPALAQAAPQRHRLPGGLTIITSENHEAPVVSFQVWVRAGSAYERPHEHGITHLIEHMIFKGAPAMPAGGVARRIEGLGGEVNAYTTLDHTNYYVTAASRHATQALTLLADAVVNASFDAGELEREKEVVVEEIRMGRDNPERRRHEQVMRLAFGDHPYGRPVIGTPESVRAISRADILDYRARWYTAPNMTVVAVGDFDTAKLLPVLAQVFAPLPTRPAPEFKLPPVAAPARPRLVVMREKVQQAAVSLAWRIPGLPSDEVYPLDMAAAVAGGGRTSRLWSRVKERDRLVDAVGAEAYTPAGMGLFEVEAKLEPARMDQAWPALMAQAMGLAAEPPTPAELKRAGVNAQADWVKSRQTMQGQARMLGYFELLRGGYEKAAEYLDRYRAVRAADVAAAARAHLRPELLSVVVQVPEGAGAPEAAAILAQAQALMAAWPAGGASAEGQARRTRLANGLTLIVKPQRALPLVAFTLAAPGGQAAEDAATAGLHQLWARAVGRGSIETGYEALTTELEDRAASLVGFAGKSSAGLAGSFLAQDWRRGLELMAELWREPAFAPDQVDQAKAEQMARLRAQEDQPPARAFKALRRLLYGDHPYAQDPLGAAESLAGLGRDQLLAAHQAMRGPQGVVLSVVGDVEPQAVAEEVERLLGGLSGRARQPDPTPPAAIATPRLQTLSDPAAQQTQVLLGYLAPSATDPQRYPLEVLEAILGGQGGRLFRDLRDQESLAYAVQSFYSDAWQVGVFGAYMAVGPGKTDQALAGLLDHLERVRREPPTAEEMERARNYLLGSQAIGLQGYAAQAATMAADELLGLGFDNHLKTPGQIEAVTAEAVRRAAAEVLDPGRRAQLVQGR